MRVWYGGLILTFLFCKQKTAYEMRISDWSADVCSSDLSRMTARGAILSADIALKRSTRSRSASVSAGIVAVIRLQAKGAMQFEVKIGRASCRGRVCPYV